MRVAFNQTSILRTRTGIGTYAQQLMAALRNEGVDIEGVPSGLLAKLYCRGGTLLNKLDGSRRSAAATAIARPERWYHPAPWFHRGKQLGQRWFLNQALRELTSGSCDLYHEPNYLALQSQVPTIVTVHDLSVMRMPQFHPVERIRTYERLFAKSLEQAAHVLTVSETIRQEMIRYLGYPAHKVTTTHNGVRPGLRPLAQEVLSARWKALGLPDQYLLYLGTLEPRKNILQLMQIYCGLPEPLRARCPLILAGSWGWNYQEIAQYYQSHARHAHVRHLGCISDNDLVFLYNGARALVSPSYYEGFGLPPVEMLACGGAVLASRIGATEEVLGTQAYLLDPDDQDGWHQALQRIIVDDDWRQELRRGACEAVAGFTWQKCARTTLAVYRQVLGRATEPIRKAS